MNWEPPLADAPFTEGRRSRLRTAKQYMRRGITGLLDAFRESLEEVKDGAKVVFTGTIGVCTPFTELLAYSVRNRNFEMVYVPNADVSKAKRMKFVEDIGYCVADEPADPKNADVVVVLGGLAMPKYPCDAEDVLKFLREVCKPSAKVIGFCFMNIFERQNWLSKIEFDTVINGTIDVEVKRKS